MKGTGIEIPPFEGLTYLNFGKDLRLEEDKYITLVKEGYMTEDCLYLVRG